MPWEDSPPATLKQLQDAKISWLNQEISNLKTNYGKRIMNLENIIHDHDNPSISSLLERVTNLENLKISQQNSEPRIKEEALSMYSGGSTRRKSKIKEPIKSKNKQKKLRKTKRLK